LRGPDNEVVNIQNEIGKDLGYQTSGIGKARENHGEIKEIWEGGREKGGGEKEGFLGRRATIAEILEKG